MRNYNNVSFNEITYFCKLINVQGYVYKVYDFKATNDLVNIYFFQLHGIEISNMTGGITEELPLLLPY